jgi:crotonobetainyl-CoA:carnitine CoA-transferase CaiB-like acyl-CoA transferase
MGPIDGITVVALEQAVAVPFATRQLADLGARVIKIERPGSGDVARAYDTTVRGLASNKLRVDHRAAMNTEIEHVFARLSSAEVVARLDAAHIANARINSVASFIAHPQLVGRDSWRDIGSPVGPVRALVPPVRMEDMEPVMGAVPALGEHTDSVLSELGFERRTIESWRLEGIV